MVYLCNKGHFMITGLTRRYFGDLVLEITSFSPQNSATQNKIVKTDVLQIRKMEKWNI